MDWLDSVGAVIDCRKKTVEIGSRQKIHFRTTPEPTPAVMAVDSEGLPYELHLARVRTGQTLVARHTTIVECVAPSSWQSDLPGVFEAVVHLGSGVDVLTCLVQPNPTTRVFVLGISNATTQDIKLGQDMILGKLCHVAELPEGGVTGMSPSYVQGTQLAIWEVPHSVATPVSAESDPNAPELRNKRESQPLVQDDGQERSHSETGAQTRYVTCSTQGTSSEPLAFDEAVTVYNCQGRVIPGQDRIQPEEVVLQEEARASWDTILLAEPNRTSWHGPSESKRVREVSSSPRFPRTAENRLPEHLRCMLPPPGVLTSSQVELAVDLVLTYQDVFVGPDGKVGFTNRVRHKIDTGQSEPCLDRLRKKSIPEKAHIGREVAKLLKEGQICPSQSPWASAVVLVK
jgi:hypothetical protein